MCEFRLRVFVVLVLAFFWTTSATRTCHYCNGINCQRTNYNKTEVCQNDVDVCVTIFDGSLIEAQGCYQQLGEELRQKCMDSDIDMMDRSPLSQCHKCLSSLCNDKGPLNYECIQCDSAKEENCRSDPTSLRPTQCPISRANNAYCYVSDDGNRTVRGCAGMVQDQKNCLTQDNCFLCSPMDVHACNRADVTKDEGSGGGNGGDGGGDGGGNGGDGGGNGGDGGGNGGDGGGNGGDGSGNGGDGGGSGGDGGGSGGGDNNKSSIATINYITFVFCLTTLLIGIVQA